MTFERGVILKKLPGDFEFEPGYHFQKDICIYVMGNNDMNSSRIYYFLSGAVVRKVSIGDFDASRSELMIEKIEIAYEKLDKEKH